jgi:pyruvate formate lyase activating enzyme
MIFGGIQKTSTIDFPHELSCVLFTRGCDLDCFYCHNRELLHGNSPFVKEEEILAFLKKRIGLLDGVVISGGESTLQSDLPDFIRTVRQMGYHIKLDTNGQNSALVTTLWKEGLLDYVAIDIKALPEDYKAVCGIEGFSSTKATIHQLLLLHADFEVRTTLYPGMTLNQLQKLLSLFPVLPKWRLNYFRQPQCYKEEDTLRLQLPALNAIQIQENKESLLSCQPNLIL